MFSGGGPLVEAWIRVRSSFDAAGTNAAKRGVNELEGHIARAGQAAGLLAARSRNALLVSGAALAGVAVVYGKVEQSQVNLLRVSGLNERQFRRTREQLSRMTTSLGMSEHAITNLAAEAARAGIEGGDLTKFVTTVRQASVALGVDAGETAEQLAKLRASFGLNVDEIHRLTGSVIALDSASSATFPTILEFMRRLGPSARILGVSAQEVAAMATTLLEVGINPERASTAIRNIFQKFRLNSEQIAPLIGMSSEGLLANPVAALRRFASAFSSAQGAQLEGLTAALGLPGSRVTEVLSALAENSTRLAGHLGAANDEFREGGLLARFFGAQARTLAFRFEVLKAALLGAARAIGERLAPFFGGIVAVVTKIAIAIRDSPVLQYIAALGLVGTVLMSLVSFLGFFTAANIIAFTVIFRSLPQIVGLWDSLTASITGSTLAMAAFTRQSAAATGASLGARGGALAGLFGNLLSPEARSGQLTSIGNRFRTGGIASAAGSLAFIPERGAKLGTQAGFLPRLTAMGGGLRSVLGVLGRVAVVGAVIGGIFDAWTNNLLGVRTLFEGIVKPFKEIFGGESANGVRTLVDAFKVLTRIMGYFTAALMWLVGGPLWVVAQVLGKILEGIMFVIGWLGQFTTSPLARGLGVSEGSSGGDLLAPASLRPANLNPSGATAAVQGSTSYSFTFQNPSIRSEDDMRRVEEVVMRRIREHDARMASQ